MKIIAVIALILGGLPLIIYPMLFIANMISFAAIVAEMKGGGNLSVIPLIVTGSFLITSTAYPWVYVPCVRATIARMRKGEDVPAFQFSLAPLAYLVLVMLLLALWSVVGRG